MKPEPRTRERGLALIVLVILVVITGLIGYTLVGIVSAHRFSAVDIYQSARAFYLAEAALEIGKNDLSRRGEPETGAVTGVPLGGGSYDLSAHWDPDSSFVRFTAVGRFGEISRTVSELVYFEAGGGAIFPSAIGLFGRTLFQMGGSGGVYSFDPDLQDPPPTAVAQMGPGHIGSNERIVLSGSVTVSGQVNVPHSILDEIAAGDFSNLQGGWSVSVGTKLPVGTTGEQGDPREFDGPRVPAQLQGWQQNPDSTWLSGTPAWPYDPNYAPYPEVYEFDPQWDQNGDGATTPADYDYFVERGGFAAGRGGPTTEIPYTQPNDPTIMVMGNDGLLVPAVEGQGRDYRIDEDHNFTGTWKALYFTGDQYRFNNFESGGSQSYHYTAEMDFYVENFLHRGSSSSVIGPNGGMMLAVRDSIAFVGNANFNVGGRTDQFQVFTPGETVNIQSTNGSSGAFYAPNADIDLGRSGMIHAAIVANSVIIGGSRIVCYPLNYRGPDDGTGSVPGETDEVILEREVWRDNTGVGPQ